MKVEVSREKIRNAIQKAEKAVGKNLNLPVLSCVQIEAKKTHIIIRSTNLDLGIEIIIPAQVLEEGTVAVPAPTLNSFFSNLGDEKDITLEEKNGNLYVSTGSISATIKSFPSDDFPSIPRIKDGKETKIDIKGFLRGIKSVIFSAATSTIKPELASVCIYNDDGELVFVSTDSFRLAEKKVKAPKGFEVDHILIPSKNAAEIVRILDEYNGDVSLTLTDSQISLEFGDIYITSRLIEGIFPDYRQIIPKEFTSEAILLKQDLITSLRMANIFSDNFNQINFSILPGKKIFELKTKNNDVGENISSIHAALTGESLTINFNYRYIIDCFAPIEADSVSLNFNGLSKPMVIKGVSDRSFLYLVMPMNK